MTDDGKMQKWVCFLFEICSQIQTFWTSSGQTATCEMRVTVTNLTRSSFLIFLTIIIADLTLAKNCPDQANCSLECQIEQNYQIWQFFHVSIFANSSSIGECSVTCQRFSPGGSHCGLVNWCAARYRPISAWNCFCGRRKDGSSLLRIGRDS